MEDKNAAFSYTYSATQQEEIKRIRQKYIPSEENKMDQLRQLDACATRLGAVIALIVGVLSTLVMGIGMCCTMVWTQYFILGIVIGIFGIAGVCATYPIYAVTTKRQRQKLAPEIMRLSAELMGQQK